MRLEKPIKGLLLRSRREPPLYHQDKPRIFEAHYVSYNDIPQLQTISVGQQDGLTTPDAAALLLYLDHISDLNHLSSADCNCWEVPRLPLRKEDLIVAYDNAVVLGQTETPGGNALNPDAPDDRV